MSFKTKKIRSDRAIKTQKIAKKAKHGIFSFIKGHFAIIIIIIIATSSLYVIGTKAISIIGSISESGLSVKNTLLSIVSSPLEEDEFGHTNFLLLGVGGEDHDGGDLTDSIIVASLDSDKNLVSMLSIPRDLYIKYSDTYGDRINRYYEISMIDYVNDGYSDTQAQTMALEDLTEKISDIVDTEIHYYALIDFNGFTEIVDAIGGIDVYLAESFYDSSYPVDGTDLYTTFSLPAGENHLDGETALKYARSRHTTSDFDRALRQQEILNAIKDKAFSLGVLGSPSKLKDIYEAVSSNFITNLSFTEIAEMGKMADDFSSDSMLSQVFSDTPWEIAGFLYTPPREEFGGASVLLPSAGDYSEMQYFTDLFFYNQELFLNKTPLQVVNSSKYEGLATDTMIYLERYGFEVVRYGNAARIGETQTTIFNLAGEEIADDPTFDFLLEMLPSAVVATEIPEDYSPLNWETEADILIEIGTDFIPYYEENYDERFYYWTQ